MSATKEISIIVNNEQAMAGLACMLADCMSKPVVITLSGDLGAGKTTFARAFIRRVCDPAEDVLSPTFMLRQDYQTKAGIPLHHFDFYRIKHPRELVEIGLGDVIEHGICLIEWPEVAQDWLPVGSLNLTIEYQHQSSKRNVRISSSGSYGSSMIADIEQRRHRL